MRVLAGIAGALLLACSRPAPPAEPPTGFVNKVWKVSESSQVAPGTLYALLSEGTLVITSDHGTPALGTWRYERDTLTLVEEGIPYRTEILELARDRLRIRVHDSGEPLEITLIPAEGGTP